MLHKETATTDLLDLIRQLMADENLKSFYLAGGTALSLQIGHRTSVDIDLFNDDLFIGGGLANYIKSRFDADIKVHKKSTVMCMINDIRVGFVAHPYHHVQPLLNLDSIKMASLEDIAAMKINAIVTNGTRLKDCYDIHFLEKKFGLDSILNNYLKKYPNVDLDMAVKSLLYHDDIDFSVKFKLMNREIKWPEIAKDLKNAVSLYKQKIRTNEFNEKLKQAAKDNPDQANSRNNDTGQTPGPKR